MVGSRLWWRKRRRNARRKANDLFHKPRHNLLERISKHCRVAARIKQRVFITKGFDQLYLLARLNQHCAQSDLLALRQVVLGIS